MLIQPNIFKFKHQSLSQQVELIYQPKLSNYKIPDFMLRIISNTDETVLILDAKNKNYERSSALYNTFPEDLNYLVNKNDYSESGNNAVFILENQSIISGKVFTRCSRQ